jgi:hypothetical protein
MTEQSKNDLGSLAADFRKLAAELKGCDHHPKQKKVLRLLNEHTIVTIFTTALTCEFNS